MKAVPENPISQKFSRMGPESTYSGSNLTSVLPNYENPIPRTSIEWRILENSMEDSLLCRAAVNADGQSCRSEMRTEGAESTSVEQDPCCCEVPEFSFSTGEESTQTLPVKMGKPECVHGRNSCLCNDCSRQCLSSQTKNSLSSDGKKVSSRVDDHQEPEKLWTTHQRIEEKIARMDDEDMDSKGSACHEITYNSNGVKEAMKPRRRSDSFPPPLASLVRRSYAQFPPQLACLQLHHIRSNGRILLQEVRVAPQSLFQPIRTQGRLVLQLIHRDDENPQATIETKEHVAAEELIATAKLKINYITDIASSRRKNLLLLNRRSRINIQRTEKNSIRNQQCQMKTFQMRMMQVQDQMISSYVCVCT